MPRDASQQPLREQPSRSSADTELVAGVLGEQTAEEMAELASDTNTNRSATTAGLELSEAERLATKAAEEAVTPEERRQEYYEWAATFGGGKGWVDTGFQFNDDGTVEFLHDLMLIKPVEKIPPSLKIIHGSLDTAETTWDIPLSVLENIKIEGKLTIGILDAINLPSGIDCGVVVVYDTGTSSVPAEDVRSQLIEKGYQNVNIDF